MTAGASRRRRRRDWAWACSARGSIKLGPSRRRRRPRRWSGYLLPFEIVSVHLLVVLIGAAYLARPKRRAPLRGGAVDDRSG